MPSVTTFFWFERDAERAAEFYTATVPDSRITDITRNPDGSAFIVALELAGHAVTLMNGGPDHPLSDAASIQVVVDTQDEVDRLWSALTEGGAPGPCGWLTDRYGLSWQVVPAALPTLLNSERGAAVGAALRTMSKIDVAVLQEAHDHG
ncbi:VOC family protein [Nocardia wallacei]|uniref:VOC family protein n=1 Tax=Nocardia wallacei TaxID=480035 RepID=UPI0024563523|nr:VOC family protein [Nocardia wallacei]